MSADVMRVRLHLRGVRVTEVVVDTPTELVVGVVATKKVSGCPGCGRSCRRVHDRRRRQVRDLEVSGRRTVLLCIPAAVRVRSVWEAAHGDPSPVCGEYHSSPGAAVGPRRPGDVHPGGVPPAPCELASDHEPGHRLVRAGPNQATASEMSGVADRRDLDPQTSPLCDRGRKRDTGEVLAMFQGRSKASLSRFFVEQGPRWCHNVQTVVTDGSRSYRAAIGRYLPGVRHVLDRFHAVRWFTQGLTLVRREHPTPPTARCETRV